MPVLRRLGAALAMSLLLLQSLQGSASACVENGGTAAASAMATNEVDGHDMAAMQGMPGMSHAEHASHTAPVTRADAPRAPQRPQHHQCPDRDMDRTCATMLACVTLPALPSLRVASLAPQIDRAPIVARVARPATIVRAPELPPPRA